MKKYSVIFQDILIIIFIGIYAGMIDILFTYYKPGMLNTLFSGVLIGLIIGISIMLTDFLLYKKKIELSYFKVFLIIFFVNGTGIFTASLATGNKNIFKAITIFLITLLVSNYVIYSRRKLKKDLSFFLDKKKAEIQLIRK